MIRDTNPPEADQSESGVSEPKTTLFGEAIFQKKRGCFNHVFSEHDTRWPNKIEKNPAVTRVQRPAPPGTGETPGKARGAFRRRNPPPKFLQRRLVRDN
jgi:hypothetical protein